MNNTQVSTSGRGRRLLSMIVSILLSLGIAAMIFLPMISMSATISGIGSTTVDISLYDLTSMGINSFINDLHPNFRSSGLESSINSVFSFTTTLFFCIIIMSALILLLKILDKFKACRIIALVLSVLELLPVAVVFVVAFLTSTALGKASVYGSGYSVDVGIGAILQLLFVILLIIFTAIGIPNGKTKVPQNNTYVPPQPYTQNPVNVPPVNTQNGQYNTVAPHQLPSTPAQPTIQPVAMPVQSVAEPVRPAVPVQPVAAPAQPVAEPAKPIAAPAQPVAEPVQPAAPLPLKKEPETPAAKGAVRGTKGEYNTKTIDINDNEKIIIGRDSSVCRIVLSANNRDISRSHCTIQFNAQSGNYQVTDTSSNGTYVNGVQLVKNQETVFPKGTILSLGKGENQFELV